MNHKHIYSIKVLIILFAVKIGNVLASLKINSPVQGTVWTVGSEQEILWVPGDSGIVGPLNIYLYRGEGGNAMDQISSFSTGADAKLGKLTVSVPENLPQHDFYAVGIQESNGEYYYSHYFPITGGPINRSSASTNSTSSTSAPSTTPVSSKTSPTSPDLPNSSTSPTSSMSPTSEISQISESSISSTEPSSDPSTSSGSSGSSTSSEPSTSSESSTSSTSSDASSSSESSSLSQTTASSYFRNYSAAILLSLATTFLM